MVPVDVLIEKGATQRKVETGEIIFEAGTSPAFYYQIVSGRVRCCTFMDDGREVLHRIVGPNDSFGELAFLDGGDYLVTAVADEPCVLVRLCKDTFITLLQENPFYHFNISKSLIRDLRFKYLITKLMGQSPKYILENLFDYLHEEGKVICPDCHQLRLTRQQLANMTGLRVETVIRTIKEMEREESLSIVRGKVYVA